MVGPGEAIKSTSTIAKLLAATLFLLGHMERGVQTDIYIDEPVLSTGELVERMVRLSAKPHRRGTSHSASPHPSPGWDITADITEIDFTGVKLPSVSRLRLVSLRSFTDVNSFHSFSITAARIRDV